MIRTIVGFHQDGQGEWVASLSCWHRQHVRHQPPFRNRAWVLDQAGRTDRLGTEMECPLCDRAELPPELEVLEHVGPWDEATIPEALRSPHHPAPGRWGALRVHQGTVGFRLWPVVGPPGPMLHLRAGTVQPIPPDVAHQVVPIGPVRLDLQLLGPRRAAAPVPEGGDPACWAGLLCPECGAVLDGGPHRANCQMATGEAAGPEHASDAG